MDAIYITDYDQVGYSRKKARASNLREKAGKNIRLGATLGLARLQVQV